jgi:hypothetical protein
LPAIVMRNDQQDALGMGLGITEYAPSGKSAKEIRELWQWVWERLSCASQLEAVAPAPTSAILPVAPTDAQPHLCVAVPLAEPPVSLHSAS